MRCVKFWLLGTLEGGATDGSHPDTVGEHVVGAAWRTLEKMMTGMVFPELVQQRLFEDLARGLSGQIRLLLRAMSVW